MFFHFIFHTERKFSDSLLLEIGAISIEPLPGDRIRCLLDVAEIPPEDFLHIAAELGFYLIDKEEVPEKNWIAECPELLQTASIKDVEILPQAAEASSKAKYPIRLVLGDGFGTGHHPSTIMAIELLQHPLLQTRQISQVLDVGTGSGILALTCASLFRDCHVIAIDTHYLAIQNAEMNICLNTRNPQIQLVCGTIDSVQKMSFDLILANLYAEVLLTLEPEFLDRIIPQGALLLSGILDEHWKHIESAFAGQWDIAQHIESEDWHSALLLKR